MKVYTLTDEIRTVAGLMRTILTAPNPPKAEDMDAWAILNAFGWKFPDGTRVVLDRCELAWALDLVFES